MNTAQTDPRPVHAPAPERIDWLLVITLLNITLLSGAVQYFNIFALAGVNMALQFLLLYRVRFRLSKYIGGAAILVYVYLIYSFFVLQSISDLKFIAFRFHDIFSAVLVVNYVLVRGVSLHRSLEALFIVLIVHGFINWLIVMNFFHLFSTVPSIKAYRFLIFFGMNETYLGIHRSQGLFWEPGVYQIYLNVALHYFLFYSGRKGWAAAAFVGVVLTLSTTGVVLAMGQLAVFTIAVRESTLRKALKFIVAVPFFVAYVGFAETVVSDKISGERSGSFMARSFDTRNGLMVTLANPFGIGFNPETYQDIARRNLFNVATPLVTDRGQTNGVLILAYSTGILWAAAILFLTFRQQVFAATRWTFFVVLVGSMMTEPLFFSPFVWLFPISAMIPVISRKPKGKPLHTAGPTPPSVPDPVFRHRPVPSLTRPASGQGPKGHRAQVS